MNFRLSVNGHLSAHLGHPSVHPIALDVGTDFRLCPRHMLWSLFSAPAFLHNYKQVNSLSWVSFSPAFFLPL